jgi:tetratricopeptide (TPR) repeat protein
VRAASAFIATAILFASVASGAQASSDTIPVKARTLSDRGRAFYDAGDYASAIAAFTLAYAMAPKPGLLFNLAQAYRLQGSCDDAALMYRRFLATNPSPQGRALAEAHLATVERCLHKRAPHVAGEAAPGSVAAPRNTLATTGTASGGSSTARIEKGVGVGLTVAGGLALGVAAYYAVRARDAASDVTAAYDRPGWWKDIAPVDARGKTAATTAQIFGIGGALGVAGGVVLYLIGKHTVRPPVSVMPSVRGVEVSMSWVF